MIVVTGGTGFLGRHVVRRLLDDGSERVRVVARGVDRGDEIDGVETREADLTVPETLDGALEGADVVIHLAAKNVDTDGAGFERVNVEGTRELCRRAVAAGARAFVHSSSVGVYGHHRHRQADESTPLAPDTPLSRSKAAAEGIVLEHHHRGDFRAAVLRPRFVYGEGDVSVLPRLMRAAKRYPFLIDGGRAQLSFVHAGDFAEVALRFARDRAAPEPAAADRDPIYHVTSGEALSYRELGSLLCTTFGYREPRVSLPVWAIATPLALLESVLGRDPETVAGISSLRVRMIATDNSFSNRRLRERYPDLRFLEMAEGLASCREYYRKFA